ncbi:TIGR03085 family metal-binding protein [Kitasatospora sp. NPDC049285]|uniref:TIGR03085 family metal-binding protein n=1 Tax=Kitasatospora sp. NPDC049285 TaxID=3157096 RepID=UPI0034340794
MSSHARAERARLAELLSAAGPEAPTLCAGWTTRDLAAHLVVREARPDAAAGIRLRALAGHTEKVQNRYAARPFEELVRVFRSGPPTLSPFRLPGADAAANLVEYFVHAEDVRRAVPFEPEPVDPALAEALWKRVPVVARFSDARSPVTLQLRHPDGRMVTFRQGAGEGPAVTVTGEPGELVLFLSGRGAKAAVEASGDPEAVARVAAALPLPGN